MIEDPGLRERLGSAARRTVEERYHDAVIARQSLETWTEGAES
jgi:hypothetical protein